MQAKDSARDRRVHLLVAATCMAVVAACSAAPASVPGRTPVDGGDGAPAIVDAGSTPPPTDSGSTCNCDVSQICVGGQCKDKGALATPTFAACANPPCINVYNNCAIPLWTQAVGSVTIDSGNVRALAPGASYQYAGLPSFGGGRLYAYYQQPQAMQSTTPVSFYNGYVEMAVDKDANGAWAQNYDISYVDSISLPVSVQAEGNCQATRCGSQFADWVAKLQECPTSLRYVANGVGSCMGSYNYCITHDGTQTYDETKPYCSKMQTAHGYAGSQVYGGLFPGEPSQNVTFWDGVAGWNRGATGGSTNVAGYYAAEPYNDYARMIHVDMGCRATATVEGVYAFSTDDHQNQSGFVRCTSPVLDVIWCPYQG